VQPSRIVNFAVSWLPKHSLAVFFLLVAVGSLRIVSTYGVLSHTGDEPGHIAAGLEYLSKGTYSYNLEHPPLAHVAVALGPYLAGLRSAGLPNIWSEGLDILYRDGHSDRNLALARAGILPFFWAASLVVYLWGKRYLGEPGTAFAVLCFTFLPPILAHAGLATTDMALTATVSASFLAMMIWLDQPGPLHSLMLGGMTGLAVLSKFSALPFIPASLAAALIWYLVAERPSLSALLRGTRRYVLPLCGAALVGVVVIWGGYRFSFGDVPSFSMRLPAPELFAGIRQVITHNDAGHSAYLLGQHSKFGWWYYYFITLAVKTPLPFLGLLVCGVLLSNRRKNRGTRLAWAFSLGILLFSSFFAQINIGVRHVLPVYVGFAVVAGAGAARLLESAQKSRPARWILGGLLFWLAATSVLSHPDYLPYFNALAGNEPEQVLVDSDLDWGQDLKRLTKRLQELNAREVAFSPFYATDTEAQGFPTVHPFDPTKPSPGWNAVNLTALKAWRFGLGGEQLDITFWPEKVKPTEKIGKGMWLWYFPPKTTSRN
jgi:hypothetical protein